MLHVIVAVPRLHSVLVPVWIKPRDFLMSTRCRWWEDGSISSGRIFLHSFVVAALLLTVMALLVLEKVVALTMGCDDIAGEDTFF